MKIKDSYHFFALITITLWSLAYVFTRLALRFFTAYSLGLLRYIVASCTLIIIAFVTKMSLPEKKDLKWFLLSGAVGFFLYMIAFNKGSETVTASTSSLIIATVPIITALLAHFIHKEHLEIYQWFGIIVSFIGVLILTFLNGITEMNMDYIWLFVAAFLLSIYNLLQRKLMKRYTALQTTTFSIFSGTMMLFIFLPATVEEAIDAPAIQIFYIAVLGIFSSAIAYLSWSIALSKAKKASSVSNYMFLTPLFTTVFSIIIAKENIDFSTSMCGIIVLIGLLIFNKRQRIKDE